MVFLDDYLDKSSDLFTCCIVRSHDVSVNSMTPNVYPIMRAKSFIKQLKRLFFLEPTHVQMFLGTYSYSNVSWNLHMFKCFLEPTHVQMFLGTYTCSNVSWNLHMFKCFLEPTHV